ncbi:helix-turn-helix transcriptional regulator [Verrucomicrobiales bacterium BCK34]|nr:helix-turn-helix transcriptional regulator [Verrucomicrobiales bacterium BCK34]
MVRLLGDTAALNTDHAGRKRFLMNGLCKMIDADAWAWGLMCQPGDGQPQIYVSVVHGGFDEDRFSKFLKALEHPDMSWVAQDFFRDLAREQKQTTRSRSQIISDERFLKTEVADLWKEANIGPLLMSARPLDGNSGSSIGIYRRADQEHFSERESLIAHIMLTEVTWLHEMGWPEDRGATVPQLYRQLRIILNLLLEGMDRKSIASQLQISIHTVGGYCKEIYRHFSVSSQSELIAHFYRGNGCDRPGLPT